MTSSRELAGALRDALQDASPAVPLKAVVAAVLICARGGTPTRLGMAKTGGYSYGSSQTHYGDLLDALVEQLPHLVSAMSPGDDDPATAARLRSELREREATLASVRAELNELTERHEHVRRYALALHERLRTIEEHGGLGDAKVLPLARKRRT